MLWMRYAYPISAKESSDLAVFCCEPCLFTFIHTFHWTQFLICKPALNRWSKGLTFPWRMREYNHQALIPLIILWGVYYKKNCCSSTLGMSFERAGRKKMCTPRRCFRSPQKNLTAPCDRRMSHWRQRHVCFKQHSIRAGGYLEAEKKKNKHPENAKPGGVSTIRVLFIRECSLHGDLLEIIGIYFSTCYRILRIIKLDRSYL